MTQTSLPITVCTYVPRWDLTEWIMLEGEAKFELGMIYVSQWALKELTEQTIRTALLRHAHGDWGDIDSAYPEMHSPKPSAVNDRAVTECGEIMSLYDCDGNPFYIFTEGTGCNTRIFMLLEMQNPVDFASDGKQFIASNTLPSGAGMVEQEADLD